MIELGLGNGRTYDHLREKLPGRRIIAFDRVCAANLQVDAAGLRPRSWAKSPRPRASFVGINAALVHADIGSGYDDLDELNLRWLPGLTVELLAPGGIAASGVMLDHPELHPLPIPASVPSDRYFLYRRS